MHACLSAFCSHACTFIRLSLTCMHIYPHFARMHAFLSAFRSHACIFIRISLACMHIYPHFARMHAHLSTFSLHACTYSCRRAKIVVSICWTLLSHFNFLHHPQILPCLKSITQYRKLHVHLCAICSHACTYYSRSAKILVSIH